MRDIPDHIPDNLVWPENFEAFAATKDDTIRLRKALLCPHEWKKAGRKKEVA